jgi:hypothetical protein
MNTIFNTLLKENGYPPIGTIIKTPMGNELLVVRYEFTLDHSFVVVNPLDRDFDIYWPTETVKNECTWSV